MIDVRTELTVTPEIIRFSRLAGRFTDFRPVLGGRLDVLARRHIRQMFETQGRASGRGQWPALTPTYAARRQFPGRPILRQSDDLYDALTKRGHADQELVLERDHYSLTIAESSEVRARFVGHQLGVEQSNVPVRQMIADPLPKTFIDQVRRAMKAYIVRGEV